MPFRQLSGIYAVADCGRIAADELLFDPGHWRDVGSARELIESVCRECHTLVAYLVYCR